jgi:NitT/TauT family transport system substrate-binding protein
MKVKIERLKDNLLISIIIILAVTVLIGCTKDNKEADLNNHTGEETVISEEDKDDDKIAADNTDNTDAGKSKNADSQDDMKEDNKKDNMENSKEDNIESNKEKTEINIAALKGPTGMGMVKLMEDAEAGITTNDYKFTVAGEADVISTGLIKGEFDIAAVPCNLASVLYNKTLGKIKLIGINTLGVLYIVETGNTVNSVEDLKGRTIYSTGLGTTPQYTLNYLLSLYGIDPQKDLTIEYKTEATEVAAILENADDAVAMLPQPYVTTVMMNNDKVRIALDIEREWTAQNNNSGVVTGVVVVNSEFLENNPEAVEKFLAEYELSTDFVNNEVDIAADLVEKHGLFKAAVAKKAIPYCNITLIRDSEMKEMVQGYLSVLYEQNPNAVGGSMPGDDFYYVHE